MNAEKELLLALLIEKYGQKPGADVQMLDTRHYKKSRPKRKVSVHSWTDKDNEMLLLLRRKGQSFTNIAKNMTHYRTALGMPAVFKSGQCHSQWHNLQVKMKAASNG